MIDEPLSPDEESPMVERVAKALYMQAVKHAREQVAAEVLPIEQIVTVLEDAVKASDREAAIVIFCLVDDLATAFFRRKLTGKVSSGIDDTFLTGNGMLSTAHNKIALLAGLEWIRHSTYRNLTLMRKVRNEFAHHVEYKSFDDKPICNYINSMETHETRILDTLEEEERPVKLLTRSKFLVRSALCVFNLVQDIAVLQAAIAHRIDARSVAGGGFDAQPENIKALGRTVARIVLTVLLNQPSQSISSS